MSSIFQNNCYKVIKVYDGIINNTNYRIAINKKENEEKYKVVTFFGTEFEEKEFLNENDAINHAEANVKLCYSTIDRKDVIENAKRSAEFDKNIDSLNNEMNKTAYLKSQIGNLSKEQNKQTIDMIDTHRENVENHANNVANYLDQRQKTNVEFMNTYAAQQQKFQEEYNRNNRTNELFNQEKDMFDKFMKQRGELTDDLNKKNAILFQEGKKNQNNYRQALEYNTEIAKKAIENDKNNIKNCSDYFEQKIIEQERKFAEELQKIEDEKRKIEEGRRQKELDNRGFIRRIFYPSSSNQSVNQPRNQQSIQQSHEFSYRK